MNKEYLDYTIEILSRDDKYRFNIIWPDGKTDCDRFLYDTQKEALEEAKKQIDKLVNLK